MLLKACTNTQRMLERRETGVLAAQTPFPPACADIKAEMELCLPHDLVSCEAYTHTST